MISFFLQKALLPPGNRSLPQLSLCLCSTWQGFEGKEEEDRKKVEGEEKVLSFLVLSLVS